MLTGLGTGLGAAALTRLLQVVQRLFWGGTGTDILDTALSVPPLGHLEILLGAGLAVVIGQVVLRRLSSANSIEVTAAIWFQAGRLPAVRTLGSAVLSVIVVGMGASLGREGAPKQAGAVLADFLADRAGLSDEQRRLLVASGAGAGMGAAYGVPLGGALFAIEVLRGILALRYVLPALFTSLIATGVAWLFLPDAPTYHLPNLSNGPSAVVWALLFGPIAGVFSVGYVRLVTWAERNRPEGWARLVAPVLALGFLGGLSIWFPQLLGNGKDVTQLAFLGRVAPGLLFALLLLKPLAILLCLGSGVPGGLFTPSLTVGAMLGGGLGWLWSFVWPGVPPGLCALVGGATVLAATTQGPVSSVVLLMEMTGHDRSFILPMLLAVGTATLISRTIEPRSIYDARLTDEELQERMRVRDRPMPH